MQIHLIKPRGFAANSYFVTSDRGHGIAVDAAQPQIREEAARLGITIDRVFLTHGHFDHIGGCAALQEAGAKIGCPAQDRDLSLFHNLGPQMTGTAVAPFDVDFVYGDGDVFALGGLVIHVIATPGHTAGSCCLLIGDDSPAPPALFTGDTLFQGDVGRCDLPTGDGNALRESLDKLWALAGDYAVYPGHGGATTLERERRFNPYR